MKRIKNTVIATTVILATVSSVLLFRTVSSDKSFLDKNVESIVYAEEYTITPCIVNNFYGDLTKTTFDNFCNPFTDERNVSLCYDSFGIPSEDRMVCLK